MHTRTIPQFPSIMVPFTHPNLFQAMTKRTAELAKPRDLSEKYWASLSPASQELYLKIRPMPKATYSVDILLPDLEEFLERQRSAMASMGGTFELEPDFQRGHVWNDMQRIRFVEALLRSTANCQVMFNCPDWESAGGPDSDIPDHTFQCVDGLQRLTAVRKFMAGDFTVFDGISASDLKLTPFDPCRYRVKVSVFAFNTRADLLDFFLRLNSGGSVHSEEELTRVQDLMDKALQK